MHHMSKLSLAATAFVASSSAAAQAQGDAYNKGYGYGQKIASFVEAFVPQSNLGIGFALVVTGVLFWVVLKRKK